MVRETRHLWVGNLPDNIREDRIREHFKRYGRVQNVKILAKGSTEASGAVAGSSGSGVCAAVAFMDIRSAAKAHGAEHTLDDRPLSAEYYEPAAIPSPSAGSSPAGSGYSTGSGSAGSHSHSHSHAHSHPIAQPPHQPRFANIDRSSDEQSICGGTGVVGSTAGVGTSSGTAVSASGAASTPAWRPSTPAYIRERYRNGPTSFAGSTAATSGTAASTAIARSMRRRRRSGSAMSSCSDSSRSSSSSARSSSGESSATAAPGTSIRRPRRRKEPILALCVRNLPSRSSDSSLKDGLYHEYKKHGKVAWVKVHGQNQDRFAVVRFKRSGDAQKALEVSQDKLFFGCKISVAPYVGTDIADVDETEEYPKTSSRTLFIGNLDKDATAVVIREKFKRFGRIIDVDVKKQSTGSGAYAFCQYASASSALDAMQAMDGECVGGSRVKLGFGRATDPPNSSTPSSVVRYTPYEPSPPATSFDFPDPFYDSGLNDRFPDIATRGFESPASNRFTRYEAGVTRVRAPSYSRSSIGSVSTPGLSSSRLVRYPPSDHYDTSPHEYSIERRFRSYDDFAGAVSPVDDIIASCMGETRALQSVAVVARRPHSIKYRSPQDSSGDDTSSKRHSKTKLTCPSNAAPGPLCAESEDRSLSSERHHRTRTSMIEKHRRRRRRDSSGASRSGTPLRDERPDGPAPCEPRQIPTSWERSQTPIDLPLPKFAAEVLKITPAQPAPLPPAAAPASPSRAPSASSSSGGEAPDSPTLEERIRSLDEKYEKWSGSRIPAAEKAERGRFRHRLLDLDVNEVQPSDVVRSLLAKRSVFDEDSERLENVVTTTGTVRVSSPPPGSPHSSDSRSPYESPRSVPAPPAVPRALQYPFPSHPPTSAVLPLDDSLPFLTVESSCITAVLTPTLLTPSTPGSDSSDIPKINFNKMSIECGSISNSNTDDSLHFSGSASQKESILKVIDVLSNTISSSLVNEPCTVNDLETLVKDADSYKHFVNKSDTLDRRKLDSQENMIMKSESKSSETENKDQNHSFKKIFMEKLNKNQSDVEKPLFKSSEKLCPNLTCSDKTEISSTDDNFQENVKQAILENLESYKSSDGNIFLNQNKERSNHDRETLNCIEKYHQSENIFEASKDIPKLENQQIKEENSRINKERESERGFVKILIQDIYKRDKNINHKRILPADVIPNHDNKKVQSVDEEFECKVLDKRKDDQAQLKNISIEKERIDREKRFNEECLLREKYEDNKRLVKEQRAQEEKERLENEQRERVHLEKEEKEKTRREQERLDKEKTEKEQSEKQHAEREKNEREKLEKAEKERLEKERTVREKADRLKSDKDRSESSRQENKETDKEKHSSSTEKKHHIKSEKRKDKEKDFKYNDEALDSTFMTNIHKDRRKDKDEVICKTDTSKNKYHTERHKKECTDYKKETFHKKETETTSKCKDISRKSSREESLREMNRKDSSDSTSSRNSSDSSKSKDSDNCLETKDDAKHFKNNLIDAGGHHQRLDKAQSPKMNKETLDLRKDSITEKPRDKHSIVDQLPNHFNDMVKERHPHDLDKIRHYSVDSQCHFEEKRKERLHSTSSLPANIGCKRRMSSQDSIDSVILDESKKLKIVSENKKLSERRDSRDSRHSDKGKHSKSVKSISKFSEDRFIDDNKYVFETNEIKQKDLKENYLKEKQNRDLKTKTCDKTKSKKHEFDDKITFQNNTIIHDNEITSPEIDNCIDKEFLEQLELRSSEEDEKQKALRKEMKEKKRLQQLQQIQQFQMQQDAINQEEMLNKLKDEKRVKNEERKKEMARDKRMSTERKSREENPQTKIERRKARKLVNSSDTSDSDEPKKHSIFDIVDDEPTYISMYDKVKARSCKNMQKQEEEKRQEKIKAKFSQLKQSRAKREEKKRSTSWDEDSESDSEQKKSIKTHISSSEDDLCNRRNRELTTDSETDNDRLKLNHIKQETIEPNDFIDIKNKIFVRKNSRVRITSDTSDDDIVKKTLDKLKEIRCRVKTEVFSGQDSFCIDFDIKKRQKQLKNEKFLDLMSDLKKEPYDIKEEKCTKESIISHVFKENHSNHSLAIDKKSIFNMDVKSDNPKIEPSFKLEPKLEFEKLDSVEANSDNDSPTHKETCFIESRKKHKQKKQKRQKSSFSEEDAKTSEVCGISPTDGKKKLPIEKRKHGNKKDRRRDKIRSSTELEEGKIDKEKLKKLKKSDSLMIKSDNINTIKRDEKMEDIFGPLSDESDVEVKDPVLQTKILIESNKFSIKKSPHLFLNDCKFMSKSNDQDLMRDKLKDDTRKHKEKRRKERKIIREDENSLDVDAAGRAIEACLFADNISDENLQKDLKINVSIDIKTEGDIFRFTDGDDSLETSLFPNNALCDKIKKECKEKKKKKKRNKEDRQNRKDNHHHYHQDRHGRLKLDEQYKSVSQIDELFIKTESEISSMVGLPDVKPTLQSPSLPRLTDSPPLFKTTSLNSPLQTEDLPVQDLPLQALPPQALLPQVLPPQALVVKLIDSPLVSPTQKSTIVSSSSLSEMRRSSANFILGFGGEIDESISENAVKSISDFENPSNERKFIDKSAADCESETSKSDKIEEKPRAVISQEETEDAVAALLGESFGGGNSSFTNCYNESSESSTQIISASPGNVCVIPEEDAEEMRQAVQSLNASELDIKPDTPQSENDLQIDTDTEDGDESRQDPPEKVEIESSIGQNISVSGPSDNKSSFIGNVNLKKPQPTPTEELTLQNEVKITIEPKIPVDIKPGSILECNQITNTPSVISSSWSLGTPKSKELPQIGNPLQCIKEKQVPLNTSILQFKPQNTVSSDTAAKLMVTTRVSTPYQVINHVSRTPNIKIPEQHVIFQRAPAYMPPCMPNEVGLNLPMSALPLEVVPPRITNKTIVKGAQSLTTPTTPLQQRSPGQLTVVRVQQPPLSPIQTSHLPTHPNLSMLSPNRSSSVLVHNQNSLMPSNMTRLPVTPVLAPLSKPVLINNIASVQQSKHLFMNHTNSSSNPLSLKSTSTDTRKMESLTENLLNGPKLVFSTQNSQFTSSSAVLSQNRIVSMPLVSQSATKMSSLNMASGKVIFSVSQPPEKQDKFLTQVVPTKTDYIAESHNNLSLGQSSIIHMTSVNQETLMQQTQNTLEVLNAPRNSQHINATVGSQQRLIIPMPVTTSFHIDCLKQPSTYSLPTKVSPIVTECIKQPTYSLAARVSPIVTKGELCVNHFTGSNHIAPSSCIVTTPKSLLQSINSQTAQNVNLDSGKSTKGVILPKSIFNNSDILKQEISAPIKTGENVVYEFQMESTKLTEINSDVSLVPKSNYCENKSNTLTKCETDFEELLKDTTNEIKISHVIEKELDVTTAGSVSDLSPISTVILTSSECEIHNEKENIECITIKKSENSILKDSDNKSVSFQLLPNKDMVINDSEILSKKKASNDCIIKKVDTLSSNRDINENKSPENLNAIQDHSFSNSQDVNLPDSKDEMNPPIEISSDTVIKTSIKRGCRMRGGRGKGLLDRGIERRVQTRHANKLVRGTVTNRRGRGRIRVDKKNKNAVPQESNLPGDVYDFHEDSGDESNNSNPKSESRPRLILTIKSPLSGAVLPTIPTTSTIVTNTTVLKDSVSSEKITTVNPVSFKDEKSEKFVSPANTRRSRRLVKKETSKNSVDDVIEDVVKNATVQTRASGIVLKEPPVRRSTRQNGAKSNSSDKVANDVRKSPRAPKRGRQSSETVFDSNDDKPSNKIDKGDSGSSESKLAKITDLQESDNTNILSNKINSVSLITPVAKPLKKMLSEISGKLASTDNNTSTQNAKNSEKEFKASTTEVENMTIDNPVIGNIATAKEADTLLPDILKTGENSLEELMIDPVTAELIYMRRGADGSLQPTPRTSSISMISLKTTPNLQTVILPKTPQRLTIATSQNSSSTQQAVFSPSLQQSSHVLVTPFVTSATTTRDPPTKCVTLSGAMSSLTSNITNVSAVLACAPTSVMSISGTVSPASGVIPSAITSSVSLGSGVLVSSTAAIGGARGVGGALAARTGSAAGMPRGAAAPHTLAPLPGANSSLIGFTSVPSISPQVQMTLAEGGAYPHLTHPNYQYYRNHDVRTTTSPFVARSPLGAEGSDASSPPLELRKPPSARMPRPAHSPSPTERTHHHTYIGLGRSPPPAHGGGLGGSLGISGIPLHPSQASQPAHPGHSGPLAVHIAGGGATVGPGPAHASQVPREADSLLLLLRRYPVMWQGLLALKNDAAAVQMHFVHGNPAVAGNTLPRGVDGSTPPLRIAQRMRLEPVQLDAVHRKMQLENEHCMLLALPCGRDHMDVLQQSTNLTSGFITYLQRKLAAGIVNVAPPGHHHPVYTVHVFPSCDFANENLERIAPDLLHRVADIAHLLIVIATV